MNLLPAINPEAVSPTDRFIIYNSKTFRMVESHYSQQRANHAKKILNDWEVENDREPIYKITERETKKGTSYERSTH